MVGSLIFLTAAIWWPDRPHEEGPRETVPLTGKVDEEDAVAPPPPPPPTPRTPPLLGLPLHKQLLSWQFFYVLVFLSVHIFRQVQPDGTPTHVVVLACLMCR